MKLKTKCSICGVIVEIEPNYKGIYGVKCDACKKKIASRLADLRGSK